MLALQGTRVLDLTIRSGYCGMELADFGAEVIKVETPGVGDPLRTMLPLKNGTSPHHGFRDRGKKSITLDLTKPEGQEIFKDLVRSADVVLENYPLGTLEALGLGYEDMAKWKPTIICGRTTACGSDQTEASLAQVDIIAQAKSGAMHVTGFPDAAPTRIGFAVSERYTASFLASGICLALLGVRSGGEGQLVESSLCGSIVGVTEDKVITYSATGEDPMRTGNAHPNINPYDILSCKDGYVAIGASSDDQWKKLCVEFGVPEWGTDEKYYSNSVRGSNYFGDLRVKLEELFSNYTMQEIADKCDKILIPGTKCGTTEQALQEPQLHERNMIQTVDTHDIGALEMPGRPIKFLGETETPLLGAPVLGANNADVYGALGLDAA